MPTPTVTTTPVIAIGTRKGLFLARTDQSRPGGWRLDGPHLSMREVTALAFMPVDPAAGPSVPELLVGMKSEHWGPTVVRSADLGGTWGETDAGAVVFPADTAGSGSCSPTRRVPTWSGPAASRPRCGAARTAASTSSWFAVCGTTRTARTGAPASAAPPSTPSWSTRTTRTT